MLPFSDYKANIMSIKINVSSSIFSLVLLVSYSLTAQNAGDALRFSNFELGGTARTVGAGGALSALGTDFSVISVNPAGLAMNRRSEFVFTPGFSLTSTSSDLVTAPSDGPTDDSRGVFNFNNLGVVIVGNPKSRDWSTVNFAIGMNRIADFNQRFTFSGSSPGTIVDRFAEQANSGNFDDFETNLALQTEALLGPDADGVYTTDFDNVSFDTPIFKEQTVVSRGALNEIVFAIAGNYKERVMLGVEIGVPIVNFTEEKTYREEDLGPGADGDIPFFNDLTFQEDLTITGAGINLKLGVILRPHQLVRVGGAIHTPTFFQLSDDFSTSLEYAFNDGTPFRNFAESIDGEFDYTLRTPWRFIGAGAVLLKKRGFLTAEIEYLNFGGSRFGFDVAESEEQAVNEDIENSLDQALTFKFGAEVVFKQIQFRAGLNLLPSGIQGDDTVNRAYTGGIGYRDQDYFIDIGYRRYVVDENYVPFTTITAPQQFVENEVALNRFLVTIGFKFD